MSTPPEEWRPSLPMSDSEKLEKEKLAKAWDSMIKGTIIPSSDWPMHDDKYPNYFELFYEALKKIGANDD